MFWRSSFDIKEYFLYGQSKNAGVVTIKKICDGLDITIQEFFEDPIFADLEPEL